MSESTLNERVAEEIRVAIARRRLTASELARKAGMTQRSISRRITGEKAIDMDDLERIAKALDVEVGDLLPRPALHDERGQTGRRSDKIAYPPQDPQPTPAIPVQPTRGHNGIGRTTDPHRVNGITSRTHQTRPTVRPYRHSGVPS